MPLTLYWADQNDKEVKTMNIPSTVATVSLLSMLSFGAFAATSINSQQAESRQPMGTISVDGVESSPMDMHQIGRAHV